MLGHSHVECAIAPLRLFREAGIRTWNLKSPECNIPLRYFYLREAYQAQHPCVFAFEMHRASYRIQVAYVRKIIACAQEHGSKVVLWAAPTQFKGARAYYSRVFRDVTAGFRNVEVVNMQDYYQTIGLSDSDFRDEGHLFMWGQRKTTTWFGSYLRRIGVSSKWNVRKNAWWASHEGSWETIFRKAIKR